MTLTNRDEELEHVSTAFFLERTLQDLACKKETIDKAKPLKPSMPAKPIFIPPRVNAIPYPEISIPEPSYPKFWRNAAIFFGVMIFAGTPLTAFTMFGPKILYALSLSLMYLSPALCLTCILLGYFAKGRKRSSSENEAKRIRNSADYRSRCAEIDERNRQLQERLTLEAQQRYESALEQYESSALPKYEEELKAYETTVLPEWEKEEKAVCDAIRETEATLREIYSRNLIPMKFRNLGSLAFIASFMGTSKYDMKFAIERHDKEIDQLIARKNLEANRANAILLSNILNEQQRANYLQEQAIDYLTEGNRLLKHTRNWAAASTALQAVNLIGDWRRAKRR